MLFLQGDLGGETRVLPRGFKAQVLTSFLFFFFFLLVVLRLLFLST